LVVDDEELVCELLATVLADAGCTVRQAGDGATALALIAAWHPQVVVLDVMLPTHSGYTVLERVRGGPLPQPAVFLMSAHATLTPLGATFLGAQGFWPKPFTDLGTVVQAVLQVFEVPA
jgi:CheY-like chemotaxis protein